MLILGITEVDDLSVNQYHELLRWVGGDDVIILAYLNHITRLDLDRVDRRFPKLPCMNLWRKDGEFTMVLASATSLLTLFQFLMTYYYIPRTEEMY